MERRVANLRTIGRAAVADPDREQASRTVDLLISDILKINRATIIAHEEREVSQTDAQLFQEWIARLAGGEPLAYVRGKQEFYGIELAVDTRVLIPRPETELLVERSLELIAEINSDCSLFDVGTGSGAIVLAILAELKEQRALDLFSLVRATALDVEDGALQVARANSARLGLANKVQFLKSDLLTELPSDALRAAGRTNLIVANLPYIALNDQVQESVKRFEPASALWAGEEGLDIITRLAKQIIERAATGTILLLEVGAEQAAQVESLLLLTGYRSIVRHRDLRQIERVVEARI